MWVATAAGLEVVTGAGLVVAPSLLASLLFGSEMNASGDLVGRISGLVMVCLALGCWPRSLDGEDRQAIPPLLALGLLANAKVTIESLIAEAEAARAKAMSEKGGAAAAVCALTAKAKLAGMWREKVDQHNTGSPVYERIERVIVERPPQSNDVRPSLSEPRNEIEHKITYEELAALSKPPPRHWSA